MLKARMMSMGISITHRSQSSSFMNMQDDSLGLRKQMFGIKNTNIFLKKVLIYQLAGYSFLDTSVTPLFSLGGIWKVKQKKWIPFHYLR